MFDHRRRKKDRDGLEVSRSFKNGMFPDFAVSRGGLDANKPDSLYDEQGLFAMMRHASGYF
jgi:hypothetical protein